MIKRKNNKHTHLHISKLWVGNSKLNKTSIIIFILFVFAITFMTVGFALYGKTLNFGGTAILKKNGKVYISNVRTISTNHGTANPEHTDTNIDFNMEFTTTQSQSDANDYGAVFEVTITNESFYDYTYSMPSYSPTINRKSNGAPIDSSYIGYTTEGIDTGDIIEKGTSKTFKVIFQFTNPLSRATDTFVIDGDFVPTVREDTSGSLMGEVADSTPGDLTGNNELAEFSIDVINTYKESKNFTIIAVGDKFVVTDENGNTGVEYTIDANTRQTYNFYLKKVSGAEYTSSTSRVNIEIVPSGQSASTAGIVSVLVDQNATYDDTVAPTISDVTAEISNTEGTAIVSWVGKDDQEYPESYTVIVYRNGSELKSVQTQSDETTMELTGLAEGTYTFTVIGVDPSGNTATAQEISDATTEPGHASKSEEITLKWNFTVTYNCTDVNSSGNTTVKRGSDYTGSLTKKSGYNLPNSITVTMQGNSSPRYDYEASNGSIKVYNVVGNVTITAKGIENGCLVKGTKILLANGKYKNIEDIKYTDLLAVYDHVNGKMTAVYPIWIEKEGESNNYRKITFDDGTDLKIVNSHSLFDVDKKRYVDASNDKEFKIGSRVYKVENSKLEIVTVTNIEDIQEEVKYYSIVSTLYYNIIANDILTTDTTSSISNVYGFDREAKYGIGYKVLSKGKGLEYKDIKSIPYYLYKGLNLRNAKLLLNKNLDTEFLSNFIEERTIEPITKNGKMYFMVTTSLDNVNDKNVDKYLHKEWSTYKLPKGKAKYYIETSTNKRYEPGESIKVENSIHFKAIK